MANFDPYRAGQKAYAAGVKAPSMKPTGMNEKAWSEWKRGWEDAQQAHADAVIREQEGSGR